jgi:two-component sensor histidine kinase
LGELAKGQIAPFRPDAGDRLKIRGPKVLLGPAQVIALGAVLNELAPNACKYGALSVPDGKVELDWDLALEDGAEQLRLIWAERDGPIIKPPAKQGLGSRIIQRGLPNARIDWQFTPRGVVCKIDLVLERRSGARGRGAGHFAHAGRHSQA